MNVLKAMDFGRYYVVFARGRQFRGRVIRRDAAIVELSEAGRVIRLGAREVKAVLELPEHRYEQIVA